jgi:cyclophilin family peptidyl-prolyl cis-trans isomerase
MWFFRLFSFYDAAILFNVVWCPMNKSFLRSALFLLLCSGSTALVAKPYVCMEMNIGGEICMELFPEAAPITVANFLHYVEDGDYTNSMIHRSVSNFVIQGGGYTVFSDGIGAIPTDPTIVNEYNQSNLRGTVAMARVGGSVNSATSQWFVNLSDNTALNTVDGGFTVFARVVKGMDVVDTIAALPRANFGAPLSETPHIAPAGSSNVDYEQLVRVMRAYRLESMAPYQCSTASPGDTLTEFCGSTVTFPVLVSGVLYEGTLQYIAGRTGLVFSVDKSKLKVIADTGQERATFANGVLTIPSLRNGSRAFTNVQLDMTSSNPLEFTVSTFTPR